LLETSAAGARHGRPPRFLNKLEALYDDWNWNTGTFLSAGGIGACWYLLTLIEKIRKRKDTAVAFTQRF
jgi:hypothetical protein